MANEAKIKALTDEVVAAKEELAGINARYSAGVATRADYKRATQLSEIIQTRQGAIRYEMAKGA